MAKRDAVVERSAVDVHRPPGRRLRRAGTRNRRQLARRDHLRDHHRGGLQRFLLLLGIGAPRPVLHDQHAERVAGAQDRHAQERVVDFFAGLGPVREGRMRLRLREVDRVGFAGHQADQAFVGAEHGVVHGLRIQALGGVQLQAAVDAQHIDRANLRHHVGGDQHHDLVEAILRADRLRHHFAKPTQQHARTAERATHGVILGAGRDRRSQRYSVRKSRPQGRSPSDASHPWAIANALCKPQAKRPVRCLGNRHGSGTFQWSTGPSIRGAVCAPGIGTWGSGFRDGRCRRVVDLRFGPCRKDRTGSTWAGSSPERCRPGQDPDR